MPNPKQKCSKKGVIMLTTLAGVKVRFRGDVYDAVRLDEHKRLFEISNGQETHMKAPGDFEARGLEEFRDEIWVKFQDDYLDETAQQHDEMDIVVKKDEKLMQVLDKLRRFGFKLSVQCQNSPLPNDLGSDTASLLLSARSDSAKSSNASTSQGRLVISENGPGAISVTKQSPMQFHSLQRLMSESTPIAESQAEQTLNYNENLVTDISNEFDVQLPPGVTRFKFPLLREFHAVARVRFWFQKDQPPLRFFAKGQVIVLGERITKPEVADEVSDLEISRQQLYMLDERAFQGCSKMVWSARELKDLCDTFIHELQRYVADSYHAERIQVAYRKDVKRRLDDLKNSRSCGDLGRVDVRVSSLTPVSRLRASIQTIVEYKLTLRVLERFIEAVIKAFDAVVLGLSKLVVCFFTYNNPNFKLSRFIGYLMRLVSEEITDLRLAYMEVFTALLTRNSPSRPPDEVRFLKEFWIATHPTVFEEADVETLLGQPVAALVEETMEWRLGRLRRVQSKFENLWESFL